MTTRRASPTSALSSQNAPTRRATSHSAFSFAPYHPPAYYYYTDAPHSSSPVGSLEEETTNALQLHESPFGEDEAEDAAEEVRSRSMPSPARTRRSTSSAQPSTRTFTHSSSSSSIECRCPHTPSPNGCGAHSSSSGAPARAGTGV
ncbi:hypothetical protein NUW54_g5674 [Trametes sanguinea]|uniref:Uncharacterized protein n=1 Tax=Trametes sanguinea TaxID=158606 RepID=A0ACC1PVF8_9APHY|nr:hypothetical protein NUW54_g5674 [Trametes sanguinea]